MGSDAAVFEGHLADSVGVLESVDGAGDTVVGWRYGGDESCAAAAYEAVAEHSGELALAEGSVGTGLVDAADALFKLEIKCDLRNRMKQNKLEILKASLNVCYFTTVS